MRNCQKHGYSLDTASLAFSMKRGIGVVSTWSKQNWIDFCKWLMEDNEGSGKRKIVINTSHDGRFSISSAGKKWLAEHGMDESSLDFGYSRRDNELLVQMVEELGSSANGRYADLKIVEIPKDVEWEIHECACKEWIAEKHRTWVAD